MSQLAIGIIGSNAREGMNLPRRAGARKQKAITFFLHFLCTGYQQVWHRLKGRSFHLKRWVQIIQINKQMISQVCQFFRLWLIPDIVKSRTNNRRHIQLPYYTMISLTYSSHTPEWVATLPWCHRKSFQLLVMDCDISYGFVIHSPCCIGVHSFSPSYIIVFYGRCSISPNAFSGSVWAAILPFDSSNWCRFAYFKPVSL